MTNFARAWAALAIFVLVGVTAGCSSPADPPTVVAKPKTSTQPIKKTPVKAVRGAPSKSKPAAGKLTYCAPLAVWNATAKKMPRQSTAAALRKLSPMLIPIIAAARADGKTDVATFLNLMKIGFNDEDDLTKQQQTVVIAGLTKFKPVFLKDCGFVFGK